MVLFIHRFFFTALILLSIIGCDLPQEERIQNKIEFEIDSLLNVNDFNGVVLVMQNDDTLFCKSRGFKDLDRGIELSENDQFVVGSISKQITAVLVLQAFERGELLLTDTLNAYFDTIQQVWIDEVTIHHLLTHTHGITALDAPTEFEPGSQFHYSQLGFELLAQILEKTSGQTFEALSAELFERCGMDNSCHPNSNKQVRLVNGYEENEAGEMLFTDASFENYVAAGGFVSIAKDLARWNSLLHSGRLLKDDTFAKMKTPYATREHPVFDDVKYGYGLLFKEGEEDFEIGALGYAPGFSSASYYYPKSKSQIVVLSNVVKQLDDFRSVFEVHTTIMNIGANLL